MALKNYTSFSLLEEYLNYLTVIKGRSQNTVIEYRTDVLMFFSFLKKQRNIFGDRYDLAFVDAEFIRSITLNDMYAFISHCQNEKRLPLAPGQEKSFPSASFGSTSRQKPKSSTIMFPRNWKHQKSLSECQSTSRWRNQFAC
jgi:hypothetical protein